MVSASGGVVVSYRKTEEQMDRHWKSHAGGDEITADGFMSSPTCTTCQPLDVRIRSLPSHRISEVGSSCHIGGKPLPIPPSFELSLQHHLSVRGQNGGYARAMAAAYLDFSLARGWRGGEESLEGPPDRRQLALIWGRDATTHMRGERRRRLMAGLVFMRWGNVLLPEPVWLVEGSWGLEDGVGPLHSSCTGAVCGNNMLNNWIIFFHNKSCSFEVHLWLVFSTLSVLSSRLSSSTKVKDSQLTLEPWPGELWPLSKTLLSGESHQSKTAWSSVLSMEPRRIMDSTVFCGRQIYRDEIIVTTAHLCSHSRALAYLSIKTEKHTYTHFQLYFFLPRLQWCLGRKKKCLVLVSC